MTIAWFRDLIIIIYGLVGTLFLVFMGIMAFTLFRRLEVILDSLKVISANIQEISEVAKEQLMRPINRVSSILLGIIRWLEMIGGILKRGRRN